MWPVVKLGEVLVERREVPSIDDLASGRVRMVSKISFNTGQIEFRSNAKTNTGMILAYPGDLLISGINASKGAIAVYDSDNAKNVAATIHYSAYAPNLEITDLKYLWWFLRSQQFQELLEHHVPGGIKTELKAKRFLPIPIPLPPLAEQRRIVARIEELAAQINDARKLRRQAVKEAEAFITSFHVNASGERTKKLGDIVHLDENLELVEPNGNYPQVGIKSFGKGLFTKAAVQGTDTAYRFFNRLYSGALVLSQVKGWEGAVAVCSPELEGWFVSPEYRTFRCISTETRAEYLKSLVSTEWFWSNLAHATRGVGARRERTRPEQFLDIELPMPDINQQHQGEKLFKEVDALKRLQAETAAGLDALLPAVLDRAFKGEL
jgi:type I restriction enzyme S subunit